VAVLEHCTVIDSNFMAATNYSSVVTASFINSNVGYIVAQITKLIGN